MNKPFFRNAGPATFFEPGRTRAGYRVPAVALFRLVLYFGLLNILLPIDSALAIPPFARQTGLECSACHTVYPQLTPFGRQFKLSGYTMGEAPVFERLGAWVQGSLTHTREDQPADAAPHFGDNNNFALDQASLFYGGTIFGKIGAFLQGTYDGIGRIWEWDNMDVRFADETSLGGGQLVYGLSVNNNPGVQDLWNTMPVWGFPFDSSGLAPTPAAGTLIEGGLGEIAVGGSVYGMWDDEVYGEVGLYRTLPRGAIETLAGSSAGTPKSHGVAPYWRFSWQPDLGPHELSLGTFGLYASLFPSGDHSQGSDSFTDVGVDAQYQYFWQRDNVTARISFIQEFQHLDASVALGGADNSRNQLRSLNASATYTYDQTIGITAGLMHIWGDRDATLYGTPNGLPDSTALTIQGDWLPFNKSPSAVYPWFDPKLTLQYVYYTQFDGSSGNVDGSGRNALHNNTLFLLLTLTF